MTHDMTWITEKELEREIKNEGDQFLLGKKKHEHFISAVRK